MFQTVVHSMRRDLRATLIFTREVGRRLSTSVLRRGIKQLVLDPHHRLHVIVLCQLLAMVLHELRLLNSWLLEMTYHLVV